MKIKYMAILLILLCFLIGAASAADDGTVDSLDAAQDDAVSIDAVEESDEVASTEPTSTQTDEKLEQSNDEILKTGTKTVDVNNYNEFIEAMNNATNDADNDEYVINLNSGTYTASSAVTLNPGAYQPNIIINGNGNTLTISNSKKLTINNTCNIHIKNLITQSINNYAKLTIEDTTLDESLINYGEMKIINNNFKIITNGKLTNRGNLTFINSSLPVSINFITTRNYGNLMFINSSINSGIENYGNLTIDDNCTFGPSFGLDSEEGSNVFYKDINKLVSYQRSYGGNYTIENIELNLNYRTNEGTLYFKNCTLIGDYFINTGDLFIINSTSTAYIFIKNGIVTVENSTLGGKIDVRKELTGDMGTLIIGDNVTFYSSLYIIDDGDVRSNNMEKLVPYLKNIQGTYTFNNVDIVGDRTSWGELTLINSTINGVITTYGNLTIINSTITKCFKCANTATSCIITVINSTFATASSEKIGNSGTLTIINSTNIPKIVNNGKLILPLDENKSDAEIFSSKFKITEKGTIETNDINRLFKYIANFQYETTIELGNYDERIYNYGNLTIENSTLTKQVTNYPNATLILKNTRIDANPNNQGTLYLNNVTVNCKSISNTGTLIISDDTIFAQNFKITGAGEVISNKTEIIDYVTIYTGNVVLNNKTISSNKENRGTLTLNNCSVNAKIINTGATIIIDDNTIFGINGRIIGNGEIITNDIIKLIPYISSIKGNDIIVRDMNLTNSYSFYGSVTLINCTLLGSENKNYGTLTLTNCNVSGSENMNQGTLTLTNCNVSGSENKNYGTLTLTNCNVSGSENMNQGTLTLTNCNIDVGEDNIFLTNLKTVYVSEDTNINGKINDFVNGVIYEGAPQTYVINQATVPYYFSNYGQLSPVIKDGDTLDIQGRIILNHSLIISKSLNIISTTNDGYIDLNTTAGDYFGSSQGNSFTINKNGAYTNVTGIYFHNTQLWLYNTNHVTLEGISVVVENQRIGSGVGVTSIRANSSYITVKNSYFHTTENEGSSTLVLAYANYCTIENNTIEGDGFVGNLLYITTYNVDIPDGAVFNAHNKLINNRLRGPETPTSTCYGICISGFDNLVDNNTINSNGSGIMFQWGSGVNGIEQEECVYGSGENIVSNNKLYGRCGINAGDLIYNNYIEGSLSVPANSIAYNNTASGLSIGPNSKITNNTISGKVTCNPAAKDATIENNTIKGDIEIPSTVTNVALIGNNITGSVTLDGSFNNLTNNRIITSNDYAVSSNKLGKNNTLEGNYLVANGKVGNDAVSLRDPSNVIASAGVATKVEVSVPGEVTVNKTVQVTIKLTDANGNPLDGQVIVSSALGSETVNITKGTGVYQYTPKAIGEDTISVKFAGNDTFYLSSNSSNVNVIAEKAPAQQNETKTPTKTPTKTVVSLSFVKAPKKVSKKAKKLILSAKLKINGKLAKGKKLTFKFKGKTFKVKTNKKGVAKLTIKSKVLKKLLKKVKAGKKVKYQVSYGKKTVKKTLKVKK